jgi:hypothetical protein
MVLSRNEYFLVVGASRGYVSRHFIPESVEKVTLCDTSETHLDKAIVGDGVQVEKRVMDEENIDVSGTFVFVAVIYLQEDLQVLHFEG